MSRAFILLLDSFGLGALPDADKYGDTGANTFGHIAEWAAKEGKPMSLPNLERLAIPPLARPRRGWDARQTIFPFLVIRNGAPLDPVGLQGLYQRLQTGRRPICLGQPVHVGLRDEKPVSALRLSLSARLVVEALTTPGGEAAVINRAALALVRTAAAAPT